MYINVMDNEERDLEQKLENYLKARIDGMISTYLQLQLKGVIENRLVALRLTDPTFPSFDMAIHEKLGALIDQRLNELLPPLVNTALRERLQKLGNLY